MNRTEVMDIIVIPALQTVDLNTSVDVSHQELATS